ncbi:alpha/beta fold hydrolase [Pedobacter roseus]|uniref:Alpha/beta hydrolase n=1 Tax=Pedobacter roseus TaxID=336820 RepID=A0A7G9QBA0_9SPHI|nr:alpha/beta hydrolase [Pedobacter roseus]QNN40625.1 alpha/beta hydrolase [Pedobacter roseus]
MRSIKFNIITLLTILSLTTFAQTKVVSNAYNFGIILKIEKFAGRDFRYSLELKSTETDSLKKIFIQTRQVINDDEWLDNNLAKDVTKDTLWHSLKISSKINPKAKEIWLYANFEGNGNFFVDNLKFEIKTESGDWEEFPIKNADFENNGNDPLKGFRTNANIPAGTTIGLRNRTDSIGGKALLIKTTKASVILKTNYGNNKRVGRYSNINGIKIYYETYGTGEPLLLLHGNGQSIVDFNKQIPELAKHYHVIAVDTRAHGKSIDNDSSKLSYDIFASDMKILLDSLNLKKVNILGWSDGGNTGLIMAIKYPEYVGKLIVMGANLNPTENAVEKSMLNRLKKDLKMLQQKNDAESKQMIRLLSMLSTEPNIKVEELHKIASKTLVLAGERDVIRAEHTKLIADNIKNSKLIIFKKETHMVPEENASLFNKTVIDFLKEPETKN